MQLNWCTLKCVRENIPTSEFSGKSKKNWTGQNISDGKDIKWPCQGIKKQHVLFCMWRVSLAMRLETVDLYAFNAQVWFLLGEISQGSPDRFWILLWLLTCDDITVIGFLWKKRQCQSEIISAEESELNGTQTNEAWIQVSWYGHDKRALFSPHNFVMFC